MTSKVQNVCDKVFLSDLQGLHRYSVSKLNACLEFRYHSLNNKKIGTFGQPFIWFMKHCSKSRTGVWLAKKRIKIIILNLKTKRPRIKPVDQLCWLKNIKSILEDDFIVHLSVTLDRAMESLTSQFFDLKVSKTTVMTEKCSLSFKERNLRATT